jgi:hypothetical protein
MTSAAAFGKATAPRILLKVAPSADGLLPANNQLLMTMHSNLQGYLLVEGGATQRASCHSQ